MTSLTAMASDKYWPYCIRWQNLSSKEIYALESDVFPPEYLGHGIVANERGMLILPFIFSQVSGSSTLHRPLPQVIIAWRTDDGAVLSKTVDLSFPQIIEDDPSLLNTIIINFDGDKCFFSLNIKEISDNYLFDFHEITTDGRDFDKRAVMLANGKTPTRAFSAKSNDDEDGHYRMAFVRIEGSDEPIPTEIDIHCKILYTESRDSKDTIKKAISENKNNSMSSVYFASNYRKEDIFLNSDWQIRFDSECMEAREKIK